MGSETGGEEGERRCAYCSPVPRPPWVSGVGVSIVFFDLGFLAFLGLVVGGFFWGVGDTSDTSDTKEVWGLRGVGNGGGLKGRS